MALMALLSTMTVAPSAEASERFLIADREAIMALPTSGSAWNSVVSAADQNLVPDLSNQDNSTPANAVAAGLVYVRTGDQAYRDKVVAALERLPGTESNNGARVLSVGRQVAGWVIAADLVDYRESSFVQWVSQIRTGHIGGHGRWDGLTQAHEDTASNWGSFAGASRIAASLYVGDTADVERAATIFRAWVGEAPEAWPGRAVGQGGNGFHPTADFDASWSCVGDGWTPLNTGCSSSKSELDGALVEDISRGSSSWPQDPVQPAFGYSWESMQGVTLQALLLANNGYPEAWGWSDDGLQRATAYLDRVGGFNGSNFHSVNHWVVWAIDAAYGTDYASGRAAGMGRNFGFTDWLAPALAPGGGSETGSQPEPEPDSGEETGSQTGSEDESGSDASSEGSFRDVRRSAHREAIEALDELGVLQGVTSQRFEPVRSVTRAQVATATVRAVDLTVPIPVDPSANVQFRDVGAPPHAENIIALAERGVVQGKSETTFAPGSDVTRAQVAAILVRAYEGATDSSADAGAGFSDLAGNPHEDAVRKAAEVGFVAGHDDGSFRPGTAVTREQFASMLHRYYLAVAD